MVNSLLLSYPKNTLIFRLIDFFFFVPCSDSLFGEAGLVSEFESGLIGPFGLREFLGLSCGGELMRGLVFGDGVIICGSFGDTASFVSSPVLENVESGMNHSCV
jgi:hypothetical protein